MTQTQKILSVRLRQRQILGTEATLAGIDIFEKMCLDVDTLLPPPSEVLVAANGQELDCVGTLRCVIHYCDRQCVENVYICGNIESFC